MFKHWKVALLGLALAGLAAGFVRYYAASAPIRQGTADEFWYAATTVRLVKGRQHDALLDALYEVKDGSCYYYRNAPREQIVYTVGLDEVQRDLAPMVARIDAEDEVPAWVKQGETLWTESDPDHQDASVFIRCLGVKRQHWLEKEQGSRLSLVRLREGAVRDRRVRSSWYPFVAAGELLYLAAVVVFVGWPFLRKSGPVSWAVHLGLFPILLYLPFWFGYGAWSYTTVSLKGGVLYPYLLGPLDFVPWTTVDSSVESMVPAVLEAVAPIDTTVKARRVLRGGPALVFGVGLALGLTTYGLRNMRSIRLRALRRRRRRERAVEKQHRAERMREWEVHRAEVLAEVARLLEDEFLPAFERRLLKNGVNGRDTEEVEDLDRERDLPEARPPEGRIVSERLDIANDIPFPFERAMPTVASQPQLAPAPSGPVAAPSAPNNESAENSSPEEESAPSAAASHAQASQH